MSEEADFPTRLVAANHSHTHTWWYNVPFNILSYSPSLHLRPDRGEPALGLRCMAGEVCEVRLLVPRVNASRETALVLWAQHGMSPHEQRRRRLTHTLDGSSVKMAAALRKATEEQVCAPAHTLCECICGLNLINRSALV